jgi:hypothetical protein
LDDSYKQKIRIFSFRPAEFQHKNACKLLEDSVVYFYSGSKPRLNLKKCGEDPNANDEEEELVMKNNNCKGSGEQLSKS